MSCQEIHGDEVLTTFSGRYLTEVCDHIACFQSQSSRHTPYVAPFSQIQQPMSSTNFLSPINILVIAIPFNSRAYRDPDRRSLPWSLNVLRVELAVETDLAFNEEGALAAAEESKKFTENASFKATAVKVDITDEASVDEMVQTALKEFGRIDYSVNSAGVCDLPHMFFHAQQDLTLGDSRSATSLAR